MDADDTPIGPLVEGSKQFQAPLYQRRYTWKAPQWDALWRHVLIQYGELKAFADHGDESRLRATHFLGSFVLSPVPGLAQGVARHRIVDGQQRLSTVMTLLAALRDSFDEGATDRERIANSFLLNPYKHGEDHVKLLLTESDRNEMAAILQGDATAAQGLLGSAYRYFRNAIDVERTADAGFDLEALEQAIVARLVVVEISTDPADNVHRIFQTLNTSGVSLSPVDLIRNHVFMLLDERSDEVYAEIWHPLEEELGQAGLDGFLLVDLLRRKGNKERYASKDVYRAYQEDLEEIEHDKDAVVAFLESLRERGRIYWQILDPEAADNTGIQRRLERLDEWGTATVHPLVLHILLELHEGKVSAEEAEQALLFLESYLVRRLLLKVPTNNLNRIFSEIVPLLPQEGSLPERVRLALSQPGRYWPTDDEIRARIVTEEFYKAQRPTQRQFVLRRLDEALPQEVPPNWAEVDLQIEHIMPQTLTEEWLGEMKARGDNTPIDTHRELVHTLGNLTLTKFNPELGQKPFTEKVAVMTQVFPIALTNELVALQAWGREEITERSQRLGELAIEIWPGPVAGAGGTQLYLGDWTKVQAAIDLLDLGEWTTYGDLAEIANFSPQQVQDWLYDNPTPNRHRVLLSRGTVDARAPWARDNIDAYKVDLVAEGILETQGETAGRVEARVTAADLAARLGED